MIIVNKCIFLCILTKRGYYLYMFSFYFVSNGRLAQVCVTSCHILGFLAVARPWPHFWSHERRRVFKLRRAGNGERTERSLVGGRSPAVRFGVRLDIVTPFWLQEAVLCIVVG